MLQAMCPCGAASPRLRFTHSSACSRPHVRLSGAKGADSRIGVHGQQSNRLAYLVTASVFSGWTEGGGRLGT